MFFFVESLKVLSQSSFLESLKVAFSIYILLLWCKNSETKCIIRSDYNKFTWEIFSTKIKENRLVDKPDISGFLDNSDLDENIAKLATKAELKS